MHVMSLIEWPNKTTFQYLINVITVSDHVQLISVADSFIVHVSFLHGRVTSRNLYVLAY